jgi:hypothetical protein
MRKKRGDGFDLVGVEAVEAVQGCQAGMIKIWSSLGTLLGIGKPD